MRRITFGLTSQDVRMVPPQPHLDGTMKPDWSAQLPDQVPVVRLFGVTLQGASVCAHVHGFRPFFYAELSEVAWEHLVTPSARTASSSKEQLDAELAAPADVASALEAAAAKHGRPSCRVLGLRVEWWRSAYGLRLTNSPYLRIEVADPRDVDPLASAVQSGEVLQLGRAQAYEAHLPFMLHFFAEHHLSGAGRVRVCGDSRETSGLDRVTACIVELDVIAPSGILNYTDYRQSLQAAGNSPEARALVAARLMFDWVSGCGGGRQEVVGSRSGDSGAVQGADRPQAGSRTTSLEVRQAIQRWLRGGPSPAAEAARAVALEGNARPKVQDIEDLVPSPPLKRKPRPERPPARYSNSADDPRRQAPSHVLLGIGSCSSTATAKTNTEAQEAADQDCCKSANENELGHAGGPSGSGAADSSASAAVASAPHAPAATEADEGRGSEMLVDPPGCQSASREPDNASKNIEGTAAGSQAIIDPSVSSPPHSQPCPMDCDPPSCKKQTPAQAPPAQEPPALHAGGAVAGGGCHAGSAASPKRQGVAELSTEPEWEEVCGVLSLELLSLGASGEINVVGYALRPHSCQLGGLHMKPADKHGAIAVVPTKQREAFNIHARALLQQEEFTLNLVENERDLLNAVGNFMESTNPDVCLGWEVRSRSWGSLVSRARTLRAHELLGKLPRTRDNEAPARGTRRFTKPGEAAQQGLEKPSAALSAQARWRESRESKDPGTNDSEMIAPSDLQFSGRLVLNVWRVLMHLTFGARLRGYGPHEVAYELLGRTVPYIPQSDLAALWNSSDASSKPGVVKHIQALASLSLEVMDYLQVLPRAGELSRLFGMDLLSGFTRGTQLRVESVLMRVARAAGMLLLSASQAQVRSQPALECLPLVMEPHSGFYWDPVLVLDFKGMYPSLIVGHNLSFDTCLGRARRTSEGRACQLGVMDEAWKLDADAANSLAESFADDILSDMSNDSPVRLQSGGCMFVAPSVRRGLLPLMLAEVLRLRAAAKAAMKVSSPAVASRLNQRQFALKFFANVTYGYSGASFSGRMPCAEVADAIVATGRRALEEATTFIEATEPDARVIYGDTDSVFVQLRGATLEEAFQTGRRLCKEISQLHPHPVELEFEKVYMPCVCLTKKRYGGMAYNRPPSEGGTASFEAKGLDAVRRDQCKYGSDFQRAVLEELFRTEDISSVKRCFVAKAEALLRGGVSAPPLCDLVFRREARLGTYRAEEQDGGSATLPPQAIVAYERMDAEGAASGPEFGERVSFVVACGFPGARLVDQCVEPHAVAQGSDKELDRWWYVKKVMLPVTSHLLFEGAAGLPPVDAESWLRQVPRPSVTRVHAKGFRGSLDHLLRRVCSTCRSSPAVQGMGVCRACVSDDVREAARVNVARAAHVATELRNTCIGCAGSPLWSSCSGASHCPVFSQRMAAEVEARNADLQASQLGLDGPVCSSQVLGKTGNAVARTQIDKEEEEAEVVCMSLSDDEADEGGVAASKKEHQASCAATQLLTNTQCSGEEEDDDVELKFEHSPKPSQPPQAENQTGVCDATSKAQPAITGSTSLLQEIANFVVEVSDDDADEAPPAGEAAASRVSMQQEDAGHKPAPAAAAAAAAGGGGGGGTVEGGAAIPPVAPVLAAAPPNCPGHGEPCKELEVKKPGPNLGRHFYACARPREEQCKFFAWADVQSEKRPGRSSATSAQPSREPGPEPDEHHQQQHNQVANVTPQRRLPKRQASNSATPQLRKKQRRPARPKDGRLERFVPKPSKKLAERISRAREHRILLIRVAETANGAVQAVVVGHTGNVYLVSLRSRVECSCDDFSKTHSVCKHILFVMLQVLKVPEDDQRVWQKALLPREVRELCGRLRERLQSGELADVTAPKEVISAFDAANSGPHGGPKVRGELGEECRVCSHTVNELREAVFCLNCGKNLHKDCLEALRAVAKGTASSSSLCCPSCGLEWLESSSRSSATYPGELLPPRLNLAAFSSRHNQPVTMEETYPETHQWIARREASSSGQPAQAPSSVQEAVRSADGPAPS